MSQHREAEGSHQEANLPAVKTSLLDVITEIKSHPDIAPARRREMISAIRTVCRILSLPPELAPSAPMALRDRLKSVSHVSAGLSRGRWNNVRSLTLAALNVTGIATLPGRSREPLTSDWAALRQRLCRPDLRYGLSRFMSFCSARNIAPATVDARVFEEYSEVLTNGSWVRFPKTVLRTTGLMWNRAAERTAGWPAFRVVVPSHRRRWTRSYDDLPASFRADVEAYLHHVENRNPFSDDYAPALRAATIHGRRKEILQIATAALSGGGSVDAMVSLAALTNVENAKRALRFFYDRDGQQKSEGLHNKAILLRTIACNWCKASEADCAALDDLCKRLAFKRAGMTEKNKERLRQFDDPKLLTSLLTLPERVLRRVQRTDSGNRGEAVEAMFAAAIELLLVAPMRIKNLASLETERHLVATGHTADSAVHIVIPAHEMKNNEQYEMALPAESRDLLNLYIRQFRPRLSSEPSPWLFPSYGGRQRGTVPFSGQLSKFIWRETGIRMHIHLFRQLAVKLHLEAYPDDLETARRILGHKSLKTTLRSYADIKTAAAFRKYDDLIAKLRAEARAFWTGRTLPRAACRMRKVPYPSCPRASWPEVDRTTWEASLLPGDPFEPGGLASEWAPVSQRVCELAYGSWLGWLVHNGLLDPTMPPGERATPERLAEYAQHLGALVSPFTVQGRIQMIGNVLRAITPAQDWRWIGRAAWRLRQAAIPVREKRSRLKSPAELGDLGRTIMREADTDGRSLEAAQRYRDGLTIAFLAERSIRMRNLAMIECGKHLVLRDGSWWLAFAAEDMKSRKPFECPFPPGLRQHLERYLEHYRPILLSRAGRQAPVPLKALWISRDATTLGAQTIRYHIERHTRRAFGKHLNPHLFRDCAATTIAIQDPENVAIIPTVLTHSSLATSERHYNQARSLEAGRRYHRTIAELRGALRQRHLTTNNE